LTNGNPVRSGDAVSHSGTSPHKVQSQQNPAANADPHSGITPQIP